MNNWSFVNVSKETDFVKFFLFSLLSVFLCQANSIDLSSVPQIISLAISTPVLYLSKKDFFVVIFSPIISIWLFLNNFYVFAEMSSIFYFFQEDLKWLSKCFYDDCFKILVR